ncbi:phage holin, lambda family [Erwinia amylovora]|uniref:phage holin, lambda family n=1 Tax=Erwinia amylovora TaxID=552 RepID=UPI000C07DDEA|nr:phage holin, lambda family [Erwinia amylovora]MBZ2398412.1 phage holin, lambda family [Erwinia amylovora]MBZ2401842.1 phage holin, lambda family [Erwinia amylovora]UDJ86797.1 phage holin, lambda family [Erwinia amylovora]UDJ98252.1 phage holin, lambda family [Erwinia amylovora]UDK89685.1 phage holin, lambda family [Erwinia amylovora]
MALWLNVNLLEIIKSWWRGEVPIGGVLMAIGMAVLRMKYSGESRGKTVTEGLLCGALTLTTVSAMNFFHIPQSMTVAIGGFIGFVGVKKISHHLLMYLSSRIKKE